MTNSYVLRFCSFSALLVALVLVVLGCGVRGGGAESSGGSEESYVIKFSHTLTPTTPKGQAAERFKELVEEKSEGRITVEIYPNGELYGDEDELQALQSGSVEMLGPSSSKFTTIAPQLQVLDLPFIFDGVEDIPEVVNEDSAVGRAIYENDDLAERNMQVISLWDDGLKQITSNTPVRSPEDMEGMKVRIQPADVLRNQMEAWGANPTPIAFGEVFTALEQGVVEGQENTYSAIFTARFNQVQSHLTVSDHGYIGYPIVIRKDFFDSLPGNLQQVVVDSAREAAVFNREIAADTNQKYKERIEDSGTTEIIELSDEERQAFKDMVVPVVWDEYSDVIGEDLVEDLKARQEQ